MSPKLSQRQAQACEHADPKSRCRCRCGGKLHGAARVEAVVELPEGDPHKPALVCCFVDENGKKCRRKAVIIDSSIIGAVCRQHATGDARAMADQMPPRLRKQLSIYDAFRVH